MILDYRNLEHKSLYSPYPCPGQIGLELVQMKHTLVAGDRRANEHPFLSSVHAIFLREHNRIAKLLKEYLPPHLQQVKF